MKRILVPFDGTEAARRAFAHAIELARPQPDTWLHLLNVQLPLVHPWPGTDAARQPVDEELQRQGLAVLAEAEARAAAHAVPCELEVRIGEPVDSILAAVEDNGCQDVVLGTPLAHGELSRLRERLQVHVTLVH
jgi:nucleotide-binding universal stress UspA family protein